MEKKPFTLTEYKEHPDWKVVTRDGKPARIICTDKYSKGNDSIVALIHDGEREFTNTYNPAGRCCINNHDDDLDLFLVTSEPELTDFEREVAEMLFYKQDENSWPDCVLVGKEWAKKLLDLARKELETEQRPAEWSEEDERMLSRCIKSIECSKQFSDSQTFIEAKDKEIDWLRNRVFTIKQEWSEEDEENFKDLIGYLTDSVFLLDFASKARFKRRMADWLKSLKNK